MQTVTLHWHIGDVVMKLRVRAKLKRYQLAHRAGVKPNTISALETHGNSQPETIEKVARALQTTIQEMSALIPHPTGVGQPLELKSAPAAHDLGKTIESRLKQTAQSVPSSSVVNGQTRSLQEETFAALLHDMRAATQALRIAFDYHAETVAKAVEDASRQTPTARPRVARKRPRPRKNSSKGPGAA